MPISAEFLRFHGILWNSVLAGNIGDKHGTFWWSSGRRTVCIHDFTMKYTTATRAVDGRNTENIELSLSEILPVNLVHRLHLSVAVTGDKYLVGFRGHRKLTAICGKFAAVSRGIWPTGPRNLEKFAAENCGPSRNHERRRRTCNVAHQLSK